MTHTIPDGIRKVIPRLMAAGVDTTNLTYSDAYLQALELLERCADRMDIMRAQNEMLRKCPQLPTGVEVR